MDLFFNKNKVIGLIDKHTGKVDVHDKIDVILTPSFYWVKRAFLDVHFTSQALKYAPSIFEGILPEGNYAYYVVKHKDEYLFFAYEPDVIINNLQSKGLQDSQISGIYFAENELRTITTPIQCNQDEVLVLHKNTIIQISKYLVDTSSVKRDLDDIISLSKHRITLYKSSVTHSIKELTPVLSVLGALIVLYAGQLFFTYSQQQELETLPSVFTQYRLPSTFVQNSSIEKKLAKKFKTQKSFRQVISSLLQLPLQQGEKINSVSYDKGQFLVSFQLSSMTRLDTFILQMKKSLSSTLKIKRDKNILKVSIK